VPVALLDFALVFVQPIAFVAEIYAPVRQNNFMSEKLFQLFFSSWPFRAKFSL
jgi:hypothetical protein